MRAVLFLLRPTAGNSATGGASGLTGSRASNRQPTKKRGAGICPTPTRRLPMAAEQYRLVIRGSFHGTCPTMIAPTGGCSWRSATKRTG